MTLHLFAGHFEWDAHFRSAVFLSGSFSYSPFPHLLDSVHSRLDVRVAALFSHSVALHTSKTLHSRSLACPALLDSYLKL